jgi:hypothetical protein
MDSLAVISRVRRVLRDEGVDDKIESSVTNHLIDVLGSNQNLNRRNSTDAKSAGVKKTFSPEHRAKIAAAAKARWAKVKMKNKKKAE